MSQGRAKEIGFLIWVTSWCHWSLEPKQLQKRGSRGGGEKTDYSREKRDWIIGLSGQISGDCG